MPRQRKVKGRRRRTPSWWVWILILLPVALIVWLRSGDRTGDAGMTNVATMLLSIATVLIALLWFAFARGYPLKLRLAVLGAVVLLYAAFRVLFQVEGFTGSLLPLLSPRWSASTDAPAPSEPGRAGGTVDLATRTPDDFPGFLGPGRDLTIGHVRLAGDWRQHPPRELWRRPVGAGWSGFAVVNGVAVTQEEREGRQVVAAYRAETGEPLWEHSWEGSFDHPLGGVGPRSTPAIDGGRVYALGATGRLVCLDGSTGQPIWDRRLWEEYGVTAEIEAETVSYGRANSPLVHGDLVIVPAGGVPGGRLANLVAYDKSSGERVWEGSARQISYSSPAAATLAGVEQILIVNEDSVTGHDPATGRELWSHPWPGRSFANASASQAVPVPPDRVFVSKGYGIGAALLRLIPRDDGIEVEEFWHEPRLLRTKHTNVVIRDGYAYGLSDGILECVELETGTRQWKRGRYGHGQILAAGDLLLLLSEGGELVLIEPRADEPARELARLEVLDGLTWNNLALYGDVLLVRNGQEAVALELPPAG